MAGWLIWFLPFPLTGWSTQTPVRTDSRARWGLILETIAYLLLFANQFWTRSPASWRIVCAVIFLSLASLLSWTSTRALGRHLRFDAALNPDHELVRSGPYRIVRHPIYTSMFCLLLGTGLLATPIPLLLAAIAIFYLRHGNSRAHRGPSAGLTVRCRIPRLPARRLRVCSVCTLSVPLVEFKSLDNFLLLRCNHLPAKMPVSPHSVKRHSWALWQPKRKSQPTRLMQNSPAVRRRARVRPHLLRITSSTVSPIEAACLSSSPGKAP